MTPRWVRRAAFWGAVAGVAILANFGAELAVDKYPNVTSKAGLARLVAYTHKGTS